MVAFEEEVIAGENDRKRYKMEKKRKRKRFKQTIRQVKRRRN